MKSLICDMCGTVVGAVGKDIKINNLSDIKYRVYKIFNAPSGLEFIKYEICNTCHNSITGFIETYRLNQLERHK